MGGVVREISMLHRHPKADTEGMLQTSRMER